MATKKLTELTEEQVADFTKLALAQSSVADAKVLKDDITGKHKEFIDQWEAQLRGEGVTIGNLKLKVKLSRQFLCELVK